MIGSYECKVGVGPIADVLVQSGRIIMKLRGVGWEVVWVGFEHSILVTVIYLPGSSRGGALSSHGR